MRSLPLPTDQEAVVAELALLLIYLSPGRHPSTVRALQDLLDALESATPPSRAETTSALHAHADALTTSDVVASHHIHRIAERAAGKARDNPDRTGVASLRIHYAAHWSNPSGW